MTLEIVRSVGAILVVAAVSVSPVWAQGEASAPTKGAAKAAAGESAGKSKSKAANDEKAVDVLRQLEQRYSGVNTVQGQFAQQTFDPSFNQTIASQAKFYLLKPNKFRVDYQPPKESTNLVTGQEFYQYVPELKQVQTFKFENRETPQDLNYMLLGFGVKAEDVLKVYSVHLLTEGISANSIGIQLTPLDKKTANFAYVTIQITTDQLIPWQFSIEQLSGVRTTANLDLKNLKLGGSLRESIFTPNFPKDAVVVQMQ
ncbi:MAG: outer membrane lipoprotein carrier protein LolA [Candidatus Sumerlaeaceae bacterium]|nr:outer membrane lipoprotein carrier protein LolA [Candidatus Sumerlaeaceae bacterium]